jgi:hypothetical protein
VKAVFLSPSGAPYGVLAVEPEAGANAAGQPGGECEFCHNGPAGDVHTFFGGSCTEEDPRTKRSG